MKNENNELKRLKEVFIQEALSPKALNPCWTKYSIAGDRPDEEVFFPYGMRIQHMVVQNRDLVSGGPFTVAIRLEYARTRHGRILELDSVLEKEHRISLEVIDHATESGLKNPCYTRLNSLLAHNPAYAELVRIFKLVWPTAMRCKQCERLKRTEVMNNLISIFKRR